MTTLHLSLRNLLEKAVLSAREEAEKAARAALERLAIHQEKAFSSLSPEENALRERLRAEARRLSDPLEMAGKDQDPFPALVAECAYEQWHRMLFARFLAENNLLMHPTEHVPVTLADCDELAAEEGEPDAWMVAARYAAATLPGIFRNDDPVLQVRFAAEGRQALERLLNDLPSDVFTAEDSLGWVYQFYQARRKKEVNNSGRKIGGADIAPVTQLFTEPYMVQFLLHNSLGAWWVAQHPGQDLPFELPYLRLNDDGTPAAGSFPTWPNRAADLRILDPCCGSGHFLVAAFDLLRRMRMIDEGLGEAEAGDAVLRDNLFGLEIDPRCTQIAAFNLALAAWKAGGYRALPLPSVACCGLAVGGRVHEWTQLAGKDQSLSSVLFDLYYLFKEAPDLGSLIDLNQIGPSGRKSLAEPEVVIQKLTEAIERFGSEDDPAAAIFGVTAQGVARAADLLTRKYHLVITNVPYLARGKQDTVLRTFIEKWHSAAKADLATAFVERCLAFCSPGGSVALVTPQNWLFLGSYEQLREHLLKDKTWNVVAKLGEKGFESPQAAGAFTALLILVNSTPTDAHTFIGTDASVPRVPPKKAEILRCGPLRSISQFACLQNPDARVVIEELTHGPLLSEYVTVHYGSKWSISEKVLRISGSLLPGFVDREFIH